MLEDVLVYLTPFYFALIGSWIIGPMIIAHSYKPMTAKEKAKNVRVVITSIADDKVRDVLYECIDRVIGVLGIDPIVLVDEGSEMIPELSKTVRLSVIPSDFRTDLVGKGRAMHYFAQNITEEGIWYLFLDDDTWILDSKFLTELSWYAKNKQYVAANCKIKRRRGKSNVASIMDSLYRFDDLTFYKMFTGLLGKPLLGLHGEFLLIRGDIMKEIGFGKSSITEDFVLASELIKRGYKTWQSTSCVSVLSANSIKALFEQRKRWEQGVCAELLDCPISMKVVVAYRALLGFLWAISAIALPVCLLGGFWQQVFFFSVPGIYTWFVYGYGISQLDKGEKMRYILSIPFLGILEIAVPSFMKNRKNFVVIDKSR